jgi:ribose 5-phosphate isomerase B
MSNSIQTAPLHLVFKRVIIGCDHAAFEMKNKVVKHLQDNYSNLLEKITDAGVYTADRVDYPDIAASVCKKIQNKEYDGGILLCGTGIGISIAANKFPGIRAGLVHDEYTARMTRQHNDANILCFGGRNTGEDIAKLLVDTWLTTEFAGQQHTKRLEKISAIEQLSTIDTNKNCC